MIKKFVLGLVLAGGVVASAINPASAQVNLNVHFGPRPAPIYEQAPPPPGPNYEWHRGYWAWNGNRWVWVHGRYDRRPYRDARWVPAHPDRNGVWIQGHWGG